MILEHMRDRTGEAALPWGHICVVCCSVQSSIHTILVSVHGGVGLSGLSVPFGNSLVCKTAQQTYNRGMIWSCAFWTDLWGPSEKIGRGGGNNHDGRSEKAGLKTGAWDERKYGQHTLS